MKGWFDKTLPPFLEDIDDAYDPTFEQKTRVSDSVNEDEPGSVLQFVDPNPGGFNLLNKKNAPPNINIKEKRPIGLLHIDCDIYSSTKTVFNLLKDRLVPGSVIVFDELINYPAYRKHELKAFFEVIAETKKSFEWIGSSCGVDVAQGLPVGALEGDGTCLAVAARIIA